LGISVFRIWATARSIEKADPLVQRTNGSWYHLLVRRRRAPLIAEALGGVTLPALYRAPPALLASYVRTVPAAGLSASPVPGLSPALWCRLAALLLSVTAVRRRS
jgi:hypothetical protein